MNNLNIYNNRPNLVNKKLINKLKKFNKKSNFDWDVYLKPIINFICDNSLFIFILFVITFVLVFRYKEVKRRKKENPNYNSVSYYSNN